MINQIKNKLVFLLLCALVVPQTSFGVIEPVATQEMPWWVSVACAGTFVGVVFYGFHKLIEYDSIEAVTKRHKDKFLKGATRGNWQEINAYRDSLPKWHYGTKLSNYNELLQDRDEHGRTALAHAAINGQEAMADKLISDGAQVNTKSNRSVTPLHYAARARHQGLVRKLITARADVNAQTSGGSTPFHYACRNRDNVIGGILLEAGANRELQDNNHKTAEYYLRPSQDWWNWWPSRQQQDQRGVNEPA